MRWIVVFFLYSLFGCAVETRPSVDPWLSTSTSPKQDWDLFAAEHQSDFVSRCVTPMVEYPPSNGRYLESHEYYRILLRYMLDDCYEEAISNRSDPAFLTLRESHFYSWGFRLYFGKLRNLTKLLFLEDLSTVGGDLSQDLEATEIIANIWSRDGHTDSTFMLASLLLTKDPSTSFNLTKEAAVAGNCFAQAHLAYSYAAGIGVEPDPVNAYFWYSLTQGKGLAIKNYSHKDGYPSSTNFYPAPLQQWINSIDWSGRFARGSASEDSLGSAIKIRGDYSCGLVDLYNPLPTSLASGVKQLSNLWLVGEESPKALFALSRQYKQEVFAKNTAVVGSKGGVSPPVDEAETLKSENFQRLTFKIVDSERKPLAPDELFSSVSNHVFPVYSARSDVSMRRGQASAGSAVHVRDNYFLTNCHIFDGNSYHLLRVEDDFFELSFVATEFQRDTCIFRADENLNLMAISVRSSSSLRVGEAVYAIGNPSGLERTLSNGLVSAKRQHNLVKVIQTNTEISGGSSGGALFDQFGNLVGITSFGLKGAEGLNFAIAVEEFLDIQ